ncbi:unnamed protein product [Arabidopsis halleri]
MISHDHALLEPSFSYFSRSTGDPVSENSDPTLNHKPNSENFGNQYGEETCDLRGFYKDYEHNNVFSS